MLIWSDDLEVVPFRKGDRFVNVHGARGTVLEVLHEPERYHVQWDDRFESKYDRDVFLRNVTRLCRHCDMPLEDHAEERKCLYSPTSWA